MVNNHRILIYWLFALLLSALAYAMIGVHWDSSSSFHTLMETSSTLLALMVGAMSLIRHYSHGENKYLLVGVGFMGAALLDCFHGMITSEWFHAAFHSDLNSLAPWSWFASRLLLSVMLMMSVLPWLTGKTFIKQTSLSEPALYLMVISSIAAASLYLAFGPLPQAYFSDMLISRPEEWLPAIFFALALLGYLREGAWRKVHVDHWMVLALIVSLFSQTVFMSFSRHIFDQNFDIAHGLKQLSYLFVLAGLLISTFKTFEQLDQEILEHKLADIKNRMLVAAIEKSPVAVMVTNAEANIDYCNPKALSMLGYSAEEVLGRNPKMFASGVTPQQTYAAMWEKLYKGQEWNGTFFNRKRNGEDLIEESHISPIVDENHRVTHFVAINFDITERTQIEKDTWHKANYDLLTRLPNRGLFLDRAQNALKNAKRSETPLAIMFIDLDGFKAVNDNYGHLMGDKLLQWVSAQISKSMRESDTVGRFGGDEFGILLTDFLGKGEAQQVALKVLDAICQPCRIEDTDIEISASIGIAMFPSDGDDISLLIAKADNAMYQIKKAMRCGIGFYHAVKAD